MLFFMPELARGAGCASRLARRSLPSWTCPKKPWRSRKARTCEDGAGIKKGNGRAGAGCRGTRRILKEQYDACAEYQHMHRENVLRGGFMIQLFLFGYWCTLLKALAFACVLVC